VTTHEPSGEDVPPRDDRPLFVVEASFRFRSESLERAGAELRRLAESAAAIGFEIKRGKVTEASPDDADDRGWTSYGAPLDASGG
jgi:hypothetical protein